MNPTPSPLGGPVADKRRIGDLLIESGLINQPTLEASLTEQRLTGERLGRILIRNGAITRKELVAYLSYSRDPEILSEPYESDRLPPEVLLRYRVMLLGYEESAILYASDSPKLAVEAMLSRYFPNATEFVRLPYDPETYRDYLGRLSAYQQEPGLDQILRRAVMAGASDIHLLPKPDTYALLFRQLGVRLLIEDLPRTDAIRMIAQAKDRGRADMADTQTPHDGSFRKVLLDRSVDFRLSTIPESDGERLVIRVLDPEATPPRLGSLGFSYTHEWLEAVQAPRGLCLICGPTGSGKSTTLTATLRQLDRYARSIHTVEDPVEHQLSFIGQVEVNRSRGLDFARALRGFLRSDPDVIVVGEIRDKETAYLAAQAAETGHLVFATVHADDPGEALKRLRDLGVHEQDLSALAHVGLAQRLIRTLCPDCQGAGCPDCQGTGYTGRSMLSEMTVFTPERVHDALRGQMDWPSIEYDAALRVERGETDEKEVQRILGPSWRDRIRTP